MNSYFFTRKASQDLNEIYEFIAKDNLPAASRLINLFETKCQTLAESPNMGRSREALGRGLRSFPVGRYIIFYRHNKRKVEIIRILHGARDIETILNQTDPQARLNSSS